MTTTSSGSMIATVFIALAALSAAPAVRAQAVTPGCVSDRSGAPQCPPPGGACVKDLHDEVRCSPPDGGILLDRYRTAVCGPGQCIAAKFTGDIFCSRVPKGYAALNTYGEAVCTEGCVPASAAVCISPSK